MSMGKESVWQKAVRILAELPLLKELSIRETNVVGRRTFQAVFYRRPADGIINLGNIIENCKSSRDHSYIWGFYSLGYGVCLHPPKWK